MPASPRPAPVLDVLTNQLHLTFPADWQPLQRRYTLWRYYLSERQNSYRLNADKNFFARFTNSYKNQFDRPFFFFGYDQRGHHPKTAALYTLVPVGETVGPDAPSTWRYRFGAPGTAPELIAAEQVHPAELKPHVLMKLMLALCFYETNQAREQEYRVCQSSFFLVAKTGRGEKYLTAVRFDPKVTGDELDCTLTLKVAAQTFSRVDGTTRADFLDVDAYYDLFTSQDHNYLRQLRPDQVSSFTGPKYRRTTTAVRAQVNWHADGNAKHLDAWQKTRAYLVRHIQERLAAFLPRFGFSVRYAEEKMTRLRAQEAMLPITRLAPIQVIDNRLQQADGRASQYLDWLNLYHFPLDRQKKRATTLKFELVTLATLVPDRPLLVLNDAAQEAFGYADAPKIAETDDSEVTVGAPTPRLLTAMGIADPYWVLYNQLPETAKQSLNVNPNKVDEFTVADHYLTYPLPALPTGEANTPDAADGADDDSTDADYTTTDEAAKLAKSLGMRLEVCLSELWLKWLVMGSDPMLPLTEAIPQAGAWAGWGFVHRNTLLDQQSGQLRFADLNEPAGRKALAERFTSWSIIKDTHRRRLYKKTEEDDAVGLREAHFVLLPGGYLEIECTEVLAMPNWPALIEFKHANPGKSAKRTELIGVYAGGIWYDEVARRYLVGSTQASDGTEAHGHHFYQLHCYGEVSPDEVLALIQLLAVTFVRNKRYTVWPYPFDLIRLHQELAQQAAVE